MPSQELFQDRPGLRSVSINLTDSTYELDAATRLQVELEWTDGLRAVIASADVEEGSVGDLPHALSLLADAFLWGDGARQVMAWAQEWDRSQQSRRVRKWLSEGERA